MILTFSVLGNPKGRVHTQAALNRKTGRVFTRGNASPEQKSWTAAVRDAAQAAVASQGWQKAENGAIRLGVEFVMPRPKALNWKGPHAEPRCCRGLDLGNLTKALEDSLNGVAWRDDSQISEYGPIYLRRYARPGEICHAEVSIENLGEWYEDGDAR